MEWTWHSLTTDPANFWHAPIFHPLRYTIAFSENLLGITIPLLPLYASGLKPLAIYNIAMLLGFAFSGYGAFVLGRIVTGSTGAGVIAGIFYAFLPFRFDQIAHLQHIWSGWLPLAAAALIHFARRPSWPRAGMLAVTLLFNGLSNGHWLLFGGAAIALGVVTLAVLSGRWDARYWVPLIAAIGLTYGGMYVFMQPYGIVGELYQMERWAGEAAYYSAIPSDWLTAGRYNRFYGGTTNWERGERALFPGALALLLALFSIFMLRRTDLDDAGSCKYPALMTGLDPSPFRRRIVVALDVIAIIAFIAMAAGFADRGGNANESWKRSAVPAVLLILSGLVRLWLAYPAAWGGPVRSLGERVRQSRFSPELWYAVLLVAIGYVGSLGMNSFFHQFLYSNIAPFRSLRVPARWSMVAYVGIAVLMAAGVLAIVRRLRERRRLAAFVGIALLLLIELRAAPIRWYFFDAKQAPVYEWLATTSGAGAILEVPVSQDWSEYRYMFGAIEHHRPILNGISGYPTKQHAAIRDAMLSDPVSPDLIDLLEDVGCGLIIVHNELYETPDRVRRWLSGLSETGRLTFLRRFDHGTGGDFVFAVSKVLPDVTPFRAPDQPDIAGRTPTENVRIFLEENGRTYNARTFGWLDSPKFNYEVSGELDVSGWALSPHGVREVRLSFGNGRVTMPAERFAWPRVNDVWPWYPKTDRAGFGLTIPKRPAGVSLVTDLLVEVVDETGEVTPLDHIFLEWHPRKPIRTERLDLAKLAALGGVAGVDEAGQRAISDGDPAPLVSVLLARNEGLTDSAFLDAAFAVLLDRDPGGEGRHYYMTRLERGGKRRTVIEAIINSDEFVNRLERLPLTSP